jgi:hypothetical protein
VRTRYGRQRPGAHPTARSRASCADTDFYSWLEAFGRSTGQDGLEEPNARYRLELTVCGGREGKKSGVLAVMFVHDADIEHIEPELVKDKL